ncbi:Putative Aspergillus nidulans repeat 3 region of R2-C RNA from SpoC1 gene cluster (Fragment) [Aspergillus calidoustus]|uniref:Putative Aspergillus nidulans repeat 3 region of R2-C RNA from SpoC1 gene cluster n=1 Tax=Aspergillus calidoustus TaxID=454130 RepID=A0A0U5GJZ9_ASPCI
MMSPVSNFSIDENISIFPSLEASLLIDEGTWRPTPPPAHHGFMFVNTQADVSQCVGIQRQKKAFLARNAHQRRKKEAVDRLKLPQPYRGSAPQRGEKEVENVHRNKTQIHPPHDNSMLPARVSAVLSQNHADPFCAYPVPMSSAMHMYFRHYRFYVVPTAYPFNVDRMNTWWTERAVMSPALLHTKLCLAAGHKAALESRNGVSSVACQRSRRDCLQFRMNAIRTLNDILQDPVTAVAESTVLLVGSIVTIETINAEFAALQTHMNGLATLIDLAGGLDALEHMTLSSIYQYNTPLMSVAFVAD